MNEHISLASGRGAITAAVAMAAFLAFPSPGAGEEWQRLQQSEQLGERVFLDVQSLAPDFVVAAGFYQTNPGAFIPDYVSHVVVTADSGKTFVPLGSRLPLTPLDVPSAVFFLDRSTGFVASGTGLFETNDAGQTWTEHDVEEAIKSLVFVNSTIGYAAGINSSFYKTSDSGKTWVISRLGGTTQLSHQFWLDENRGWLSGFSTAYVKLGPLGPEFIAPDAGVVFRTTNGGATWTANKPLDARGFGTLFFLADGLTGWVASEERFDMSGYAAHLHKTTDGGATWAEIPLPTFGTVNWLGTVKVPVSMLRVVTMFWADELNGYLAGSALIMDHKTSDTNPEFQTLICRTVEMSTSDGGATWKATDVGEIDVTSVGTPPPNDGEMKAGILSPDGSGWMVGDKLTVYRRDPSDMVDTVDSDDTTASAEDSGTPPNRASGCSSSSFCPTGPLPILVLLAVAAALYRRSRAACWRTPTT